MKPKKPVPPSAMPAEAQRVAEAIANEREWSVSTAQLRDAILRKFTDQLDAIAMEHPERLAQAIAIVVQAGPGRTVLVLSDPTTEDLVTELKHYYRDKLPSPLAELLKAHIPLTTP